jgi:hypothetical protein
MGNGCKKRPTRTLILWGLKFQLMGYNFSLMGKPTLIANLRELYPGMPVSKQREAFWPEMTWPNAQG